MTARRQPNSRMSTLLRSLEGVRWMHRDDFTQLLIDAAGSKTAAGVLRRELVKQQFIAPLVALTMPGKKAIEELRE